MGRDEAGGIHGAHPFEMKNRLMPSPHKAIVHFEPKKGKKEKDTTG